MSRMERSRLVFYCLVWIIGGAICFAGGPAAHATELITNGHFNTNVDGWPVSFGTTAVWDPRDAFANPSSGSLRNNTIPEASPSAGYYTGICLPLAAGSRLRVSARLMIPSGQTRTPFVGIALRFHDTSQTCMSTSGLGDVNIGYIHPSSASLDAWYYRQGVAIAPPGTDKVDVYLTINAGDGTGVAQGMYDEVSVDNRGLELDDFNLDGRADLLWRNTTTGANAIWFMAGASVAGGSYISSVGGDWNLEASGDLNGDGLTDLVWRNYTTGQNAVWYMSGDTVAGSAFLSSIGTDWKICGAADFDRDGRADIVLRNITTGQNALWYMNGSTVTSSVFLSGADTTWTLEGVGDFNVDGSPDLLWRNYTTGQNAVWYMDGASVTGGAFISGVDPVWRLSATGDFDGNGTTDLVFRNYTTGQNAIWFLTGTTVDSSYFLSSVSTEWRLEGVR